MVRMSESKLTYLDTSSLIRRAAFRAASVNPRDTAIGPVVEALLDSPERIYACSELTLLEFHSNITTMLRGNGNADWNYEWWLKARSDLLAEIAGGKITVLSMPPKATEHVMALITLATREHRRALKAWDAMHVVSAAGWAYAKDSKVEIITSDSDFEGALAVTDFEGHLSVLNLDVEAGTGMGADSRM